MIIVIFVLIYKNLYISLGISLFHLLAYVENVILYILEQTDFRNNQLSYAISLHYNLLSKHLLSLIQLSCYLTTLNNCYLLYALVKWL